jgi:serine O-acetyltransferase
MTNNKINNQVHAPATQRASLFGIEQVVSELASVRQAWRSRQVRPSEPGGRELPSRDALTKILEDLRGALFPMRLGPPDCVRKVKIFTSGIPLIRCCIHC